MRTPRGTFLQVATSGEHGVQLNGRGAVRHSQPLPETGQIYYTGTRIGFVCQTLYKAWARLAKSINISLLSALFSPYMSYDYPTSTFIPIPSREKGFSPLYQTESLMGNCKPVVQKHLVCPDAWNRSPQQDAAYRYITTDFFQKLRSILVNVSIYDSTFDMESAPVMQPYFCKEDSSELPQCFEDIPESVSTPLNIVVPEVDTSAVIEALAYHIM